MTTRNINITIGSSQLENKIKMTKIVRTIFDDLSDSNELTNTLDFAVNKHKNIKNYISQNITLGDIFENIVIIFEIDRSSPQWKVNRVVELKKNWGYDIAGISSFKYNLTVTDNSVNLIYTNLRKIAKNIETNKDDVYSLKKRNFRYQTKNEIEKGLTDDGFIVFENVSYFLRAASDGKCVLLDYNSKMYEDLIWYYFTYFYRNNTGVSIKTHTILIDSNVKERFPERFV